jgi:cation:H+ antiporter
MSFLTLVGFGLLVVAGAEVLVRGATGLAARLGIPSVVVGLTVVAYGTSAPELTVSVSAALAGAEGVALGNVLGSNIFNVLAIMGLAALITPLAVTSGLIRFDIPVMIAVSAGALLIALDGRVGRIEGAGLLATLAIYTTVLVRRGLRTGADARSDSPKAEGPPPNAAVQALLTLAGLGILMVGARGFTEAAVQIATAAGVSPLVIGLTIVAAGTSLPEAATSISAALRGERDIAVGNVVGSNIFNLLGVLGASAVVGSGGLGVPSGALTFDLPVVVAVAVVTLPMALTRATIGRFEGGVLFAFYLGYTAFLTLDAVQHPDANRVRIALFGFVAPLTILAFGAAALRRSPGPGAPPGGAR